MDIYKSYEKIERAGKPCQVFCTANSYKAVKLSGVAVFRVYPPGFSKARALRMAEERQRRFADAFIGVFDFSKGTQPTVEDYVSECREGHSQYRLARQTPEQIFRRNRESTGNDRISDAERSLYPLEPGAGGTPNPDGGNAGEGQANRRSNQNAIRLAARRNRGELRPAPGRRRSQPDNRHEGASNGSSTGNVQNPTKGS